MTANRLPLLTLFFALITLVLLVPSVGAHGSEVISRHRSSRMLKLWGPPPPMRRGLVDKILGGGGDTGSSGTGSSDAGGAANVGGAPSASASASGASSPAAGGASPTPSASASASPGVTPSPSASSNGGGVGGIPGDISSGLSAISGGVSNILGGGGASNTGSSLSPTDSATNSDTTVSPTNSVTPPSSTATSSATAVVGEPEATTTSSSSIVAPSPPASSPVTTPLTSEQKQQESSQTRFSQQTIIILGATAGSIVAAGLIWTIVRKWKFRASRDRLATIDWAPDNNGADMSDRHRLSFGSVRSGSAAGSSGVDAASQFRRNMFAPDAPSVAPDFPPPHDFTAGPARGPTPQPGLMRGPSAHRGQYGY